MIGFVNHPSMVDVKTKSIFIHVCVPGQEDNAPLWSGELVHNFFAQILYITRTCW